MDDNEFSWYQEIVEILPLSFLDGRIDDIRIQQMESITYSFDGEHYEQDYDELWGLHLEFPDCPSEDLLERFIISRTPMTSYESSIPQYVSIHPVLGEIAHVQRGARWKTFSCSDAFTTPTPKTLEVGRDIDVEISGSLYLVKAIEPCPTALCALAQEEGFLPRILGLEGNLPEWKIVAYDNKPLVIGHEDIVNRMIAEGNDKHVSVLSLSDLSAQMERTQNG